MKLLVRQRTIIFFISSLQPLCDESRMNNKIKSGILPNGVFQFRKSNKHSLWKCSVDFKDNVEQWFVQGSNIHPFRSEMSRSPSHCKMRIVVLACWRHNIGRVSVCVYAEFQIAHCNCIEPWTHGFQFDCLPHTHTLSSTQEQTLCWNWNSMVVWDESDSEIQWHKSVCECISVCVHVQSICSDCMQSNSIIQFVVSIVLERKRWTEAKKTTTHTLSDI